MKKIKFLLVTMLAALAMVVTVGTTSVFANTGDAGTYMKSNGYAFTTGSKINRGDVIEYRNNRPSEVFINGVNVIGGADGSYFGPTAGGIEFVFNVPVKFYRLSGSSISALDNGYQTGQSFEIRGDKNSIKVKWIDKKIVNLGADEEYVNFSLDGGLRIVVEEPFTESTPGISGESTVINNIDNPYTVERIKQIANLQAYDAYYGDITADIEVVRDDYTKNNTKVGSFEIEFKVTNDFGNSTTFILTVSNKDITKPVIQGPGTSTISYTEEFVLSNLMAKFTVTDNHDENVPLVKESDNHVDGVPGTYQFKFSATDKSKNSSTFTHTLNVIDDIRPIFTDINEGVLEVNWRDKVNNDVFLLGLSAHDEIDGDRTEEIKIVENNQHNEPGRTYTVKYEVADKSGNKAQLTRTYKVITTDNPVFWVSKNLLLISDVNTLTPEQIADELARYEGINMASFSFIENGYTDNEYYAGEYTIKLAINDVHGTEHIIERTMMVFEENEMPSTELSTWDKVKNFFVQAWNVIKWPFVKGWEIAKSIGNFIKGLFVKKQAISIFLLK